MQTIEIIILSFIQALTEFLPISSSGHLIIIPKLMGWADQGLEMDVAVHVGTLLSVIIYFWKDLFSMACQTISFLAAGCRSEKMTPLVKLSFVLIISTIPAIIAGIVIKKFFSIPRSTTVIAATAIIFGIVLYIADKAKARYFSEKEVDFKSGLIIGLAQAIALIPGTSRSGICITAARFLGFDRVSSARFAFLLSIPAITGAAVLTCCDALKEGHAIASAEVGLSILSSFVFGLLAIRFMLSFISRFSLTPFVIYRMILGIVLLTLF